jgi:hypothetical protein
MMNGHAPEISLAGASVTRKRFLPPPEPGKQPGRPVLRVLTMADCAAAPPRGYLVKGLLAPGDLAVLFGPPGAGKSVVAPYLAHAVAMGRKVFGRRVRQGVVLYLAAEDGSGMKQRATALRVVHGDSPAFRVVAEPIDLMGDGVTDPAHLGELRAIARRLRAVLVVVDTLAAAFPALDENDGRSMGRVVKVLRDLGAPAPARAGLPAWHGAAVVAVHHAAKAGGTTPRGHGVLDGAADVTFRIEVPEDRSAPRTVKLGKNRNGSSVEGFAFTIRPEALGEDEDGDPITAPMAQEAEGDGTSPSSSDRRANAEARLRDDTKLLLRDLRNLATKAEPISPELGMPEVQAVRRAALCEALLRSGWFREQETRPVSQSGNATMPVERSGQTRMHKALDALKSKGFAGFNQAWAWPL